jgi:uncharacterized delta-60 repeat protein
MFLRNRHRDETIKAAARTVVESLEGRVLLAYTLDPAFDGDGLAFGAGGNFVVQSDNKIVAPVNGQHALRRYNTDGSIDQTFNGANNGTVTPFPVGQIKLSGGKFIISGGGGQVARLNSNGTLDTTFGGGDGIAQVPFGIASLMIAPDGKIDLAGSRSEPNPDSPEDDMIFMDVARLNSDGSLDASFAGDGIVEGRADARYGGMIDADVQSDGKIILLDQETFSVMDGTNFNAWRLNADGTGDATFRGWGSDSYVMPTPDPVALVVAPNDTFYLINNGRVQHFNADGAEDTGYNVNGLNLSTDFASRYGGWIYGIQPLSDGKALVSGYIDGLTADQPDGANSKAFVARLLPDGNPDTSFSGTSNGMVIVNQQPNTYAFSAAVDSVNRVIVGGSTPAGKLEPNQWIARLIISSAAGQHPYRGTPFNVGDTIQAEDYDIGGEGVAYHDTDAANAGGVYRTTEGVDIEATNDNGGGYDVGYTAQGEWLEYTINLPRSGSYSIDTRVASAISGGLFHYEIDGQNVSGSIAIPNTGDWQSWTTITNNLGTLSAGTHTLRLVFDPSSNTGGQGNFDSMTINSGASPIGNGLRGEYFNNQDFTALGIIRNDPKIDFNWGNGSPDPAIGADTFSVRWTGQLRAPTTGTYTFYTTTDDGGRLTVNGKTIIDHLSPQPSTEWSGSIDLVAGTSYDIKMEYFDRYNGALAKLQWSGPGIAKQVVPTSVLFSPSNTGDFEKPSDMQNFRVTSTETQIHLFWDAATDNVGIGGYEVKLDDGNWIRLGPDARSYTFDNLQPDTMHSVVAQAFDLAGNRGSGAGWGLSTQKVSGHGLRGEYFNNQDFTDSAFTRTDPTVDFNWGSGSPDPRIGADTFSVRWSGLVESTTTGRYTFYTTTDDGVRLTVNGQRIIDKLVPQASTEWSGSIDLVAGQKYSILMEYFDRTGGAVAKLMWSGPNVAKQVIPTSQLTPADAGPDTTPPSAVPNLHVSGLTSTEIDVRWDLASDNVGVAGYEARLDQGNWTTFQGDTIGTGYKNLQPGSTHTISVRAYDSSQNRGPISSVTATTANADSTPPSAVPNFTTTAITPTAISVKWDAATDNVAVAWYELRLNGGSSIFVSPSTRNYTFSNLQPSTSYTMTIDATDAAGNRGPTSTISVATAQDTSTGGGTGLIGNYFNNMDFTSPAFTRLDTNINFNWGANSPDPSKMSDPDTFSVRWTGYITVPTTGRYTFYTTTDDGARLTINGTKVIDKLVPQAATEWSGSIDLVAGQKYALTMEYFDRYGGAQAKLQWSGPNLTKQIVPQSVLTPT